MTNRRFFLLFGLILGLGFSGSLTAGSIWLCSPVEGVEVEADGTAGPIDIGELEPPTFFRVDVDTKEVTILAPESRRGEVTVIGTVYRGEDYWVMTGLEDDRAWSMVISDEGHMTFSVTGDGATWSVFGNALREDE